MIHQLKCWTVFFDAQITGDKPFEVRKADRDYRVGDFIALNEVDARTFDETGRCCLLLITYVLGAADFEGAEDKNGIKPGFVVLGTRPCRIDYPPGQAYEVPVYEGYDGRKDR